MVQQTSQQLAPPDGTDLAGEFLGRWLATLFQRRIAQRLMRSNGIVIADVDLHDVIKMAKAETGKYG